MQVTFSRFFASASRCNTMRSWLDAASRRPSPTAPNWADLRKTPTQSTGNVALSHSSSFPWYSSQGQGGPSPSPSVVRTRSKEASNRPLDGSWSPVAPLSLSVGVAGMMEATGVFADFAPCLQRMLLPSVVDTSTQAPFNREWTTFCRLAISAGGRAQPTSYSVH